MTIRCNCDASCGENRYHDVGDSECRFRDVGEYQAYYRFDDKPKAEKAVPPAVPVNQDNEIERLRGALKTIGGIVDTHGKNCSALAVDLIKTVVDETLIGVWPAYGIIPLAAKNYKVDQN